MVRKRTGQTSLRLIEFEDGYYGVESLPEGRFKENEHGGLWVRQGQDEYLARAWTLCPDVIEVISKAAEYGFTCLIRHQHPKPSNRTEQGVEYIGFSRAPEERWVFVLDQLSCPPGQKRERVERLTFEKRYEEALRQANVNYTIQTRNAANLMVEFSQLVFALQACAESVEAVEESLGTRRWEATRAAIGFVTESILESFLLSHWSTIPELARFTYLKHQMRAGGGFLDIIASTADDLVVFELKRGRVGGEVVSQLERYLKSREVQSLAAGRPVRGVAIARAFYPGAYAASAIASFPIALWTFDGNRDWLQLHPPELS